jgi:hypothetical protein
MAEIYMTTNMCVVNEFVFSQDFSVSFGQERNDDVSLGDKVKAKKRWNSAGITLSISKPNYKHLPNRLISIYLWQARQLCHGQRRHIPE